MGFDGLLVTEIFHSLQGETSHAGLRYGFVRLTGCNLRCGYCDSTYAFKGGMRMRISEVLETLRPWGLKYILITGGEPLLQRQTPELVEALQNAGYTVSIETHGEVSIASVAGRVRIVMDIKTPGSGMHRGRYKANLKHLREGDEIKFVLTSQDDYAFARELLRSGELPAAVEVLFSPVVATPQMRSDGKSNFDLQWLAEQMIADQLNVRLQTQLHKQIWGAEKTGV